MKTPHAFLGARSPPAAGLLAALALLPGSGSCGEVGDTMGAYASAGAGVGALLGSTAAAIPYTSSQAPLDFMTGAGGHAGGLRDRNCARHRGPVPTGTTPASGQPRPGLSVAWTPQALAASWTVKF